MQKARTAIYGLLDRRERPEQYVVRLVESGDQTSARRDRGRSVIHNTPQGSQVFVAAEPGKQPAIELQWSGTVSAQDLARAMRQLGHTSVKGLASNRRRDAQKKADDDLEDLVRLIAVVQRELRSAERRPGNAGGIRTVGGRRSAEVCRLRVSNRTPVLYKSSSSDMPKSAPAGPMWFAPVRGKERHRDREGRLTLVERNRKVRRRTFLAGEVLTKG